MIVGVDEAGCGPAFGELVAAAVNIIDSIHGIADSKKMSEKKREEIFDKLTLSESKCHFGIGTVSHEEIDLHGLGWARRVVFHRALEDLVKRSDIKPSDISKIIVDGNLFEPWEGVAFECMHKADEKVECVSAASIIAKVTRDRSIVNYAKNILN